MILLLHVMSAQHPMPFVSGKAGNRRATRSRNFRDPVKSPGLGASRRNGRPETGSEPHRRAFLGAGKAAQHPRARSKRLPFSAPTCPGRPGTAPRRKPCPPVPAQAKPAGNAAGTRLSDVPDHPISGGSPALRHAYASPAFHCPFVLAPVARLRDH